MRGPGGGGVNEYLKNGHTVEAAVNDGFINKGEDTSRLLFHPWFSFPPPGGNRRHQMLRISS